MFMWYVFMLFRLDIFTKPNVILEDNMFKVKINWQANLKEIRG